MTTVTEGARQAPTEGMTREAGQALDFLAANGIMGLAWLDESLVTRRRLGRLVDWIPLDEDICDACPPFLGLRRDLLALQDEPGASLTLPNVGLKLEGGEGPKISIEVFWEGSEAAHLVVVHRLGAPSDLERQLVQEMRARRIAEENYRRAKARITEQQNLFDLFMDHAPAAIAMFDRDMRYVAATRRWTQEFGLEQEPLIGRSHYEVFPPYEGDRSRAGDDRERHRRCLEGHAVGGGLEPVARRDGGVEWVQWDHQPWRRGDDTIGGLIMFGEAVTDRIESQRMLERKNLELERVNGELEEFASIISHDLRAPLRALQDAGRRLETGPQRRPSGEAAATLRTIRDQSKRMETMLEDLRDYAQIGRGSDVLRIVDLGALARDVADSLGPHPGIEIRLLGEWPVTETAVAPLDLVLRNLVENAIKHHDRDAGTVAISVRDGGESWIIEVADDGPGIDPAFHDRIFEPFQRLEGRHGKPGSGIGLALVKKSVELHGGRIEVLSCPDRERGTTFRVHWSKTQQGHGASEPGSESQTLAAGDGAGHPRP